MSRKLIAVSLVVMLCLSVGPTDSFAADKGYRPAVAASVTLNSQDIRTLKNQQYSLVQNTEVLAAEQSSTAKAVQDLKQKSDCLAQAMNQLKIILATKAGTDKVQALVAWRQALTKEFPQYKEMINKGMTQILARVGKGESLLAALKTEHGALVKRVEALETRMTAIEASVTELKATTGNLTTTVAENVEAIAQVDTKADRAQVTADLANNLVIGLAKTTLQADTALAARLDSKQDRILFNLGGGLWSDGGGPMASVIVPLGYNFYASMTGGAGWRLTKGHGMATVSQGVLSYRMNTGMEFRMGALWATAYNSVGFRTKDAERIGGTIGVGYWPGVLGFSLDGGLCYTAQAGQTSVSTSAEMCGLAKAAVHF